MDTRQPITEGFSKASVLMAEALASLGPQNDDPHSLIQVRDGSHDGSCASSVTDVR